MTSNQVTYWYVATEPSSLRILASRSSYRLGVVDGFSTDRGTVPFKAPEMISSRNYDNKSDIYSYGKTLAHIRCYIESKNERVCIDKVIEGCCAINPNDRLTLDTVRELFKVTKEMAKRATKNQTNLCRIFARQEESRWKITSIGYHTIKRCVFDTVPALLFRIQARRGG